MLWKGSEMAKRGDANRGFRGCIVLSIWSKTLTAFEEFEPGLSDRRAVLVVDPFLAKVAFSEAVLWRIGEMIRMVSLRTRRPEKSTEGMGRGFVLWQKGRANRAREGGELALAAPKGLFSLSLSRPLTLPSPPERKRQRTLSNSLCVPSFGGPFRRGEGSFAPPPAPPHRPL